MAQLSFHRSILYYKPLYFLHTTWPKYNWTEKVHENCSFHCFRKITFRNKMASKFCHPKFNVQNKVPELKRYPSWNRGVPMASQGRKICLRVFLLCGICPVRLATVSTQELCVVCKISLVCMTRCLNRHFTFKISAKKLKNSGPSLKKN